MFQKCGYNYTKKPSQNFMMELITGPGIISALGGKPWLRFEIANS